MPKTRGLLNPNFGRRARSPRPQIFSTSRQPEQRAAQGSEEGRQRLRTSAREKSRRGGGAGGIRADGQDFLKFPRAGGFIDTN